MSALTGASTFGQVSTAQLSGRVTDQHGAIVQEPTSPRHRLTRDTRETISRTRTGVRAVESPARPISAPDFASGVHLHPAGIVLHVATSNVIDAVLMVGGVVENKSPLRPGLSSTQSSGIHVVTGRIRGALGGRNPVELVTLTGAACIPGAGITALPGGDLGRRRPGFWSDVLLDGAMHNSPQDNPHLPFPFPDALQEFSVATSALSAQYGMHATAAVTAVTKAARSFLWKRVRVLPRSAVQCHKSLRTGKG